MSTYFDNQPKHVSVEDGLSLVQGKRLGGEHSPHWYLIGRYSEGTWKDWVDLAKAIIAADEKLKASL